MAGPTRQRRRHAAAPARILTAGLSSAAALGMVAAMAVTATAGQEGGAPETALVPADAKPIPPAPASTAQPEVIVVVRRHWIPVASGPPAPAPAAVPIPTPLLVTNPARPGPVSAPPPARDPAPRPAARPVTRTRGS